jgi:hypothetical protein
MWLILFLATGGEQNKMKARVVSSHTKTAAGDTFPFLNLQLIQIGGLMKRLVSLIALAMVVLLFVPLAAMAFPEVPVNLALYGTGSRTGDNASQVVATNAWLDAGNFELSWEITQVTGGFDYQYDLVTKGMGGGFSHLILQTSLAAVFQISDFSTDPAGGTYTGPQAWGTNGNPDLPVPPGIYGIKIEPVASGINAFSVEFFSPNIPVWGDFYVKGGLTTAYNTGLGTEPVSDFQAWIPTPDSQVPVPPSLMLLGSGLLGIGALRFRKSS